MTRSSPPSTKLRNQRQDPRSFGQVDRPLPTGLKTAKRPLSPLRAAHDPNTRGLAGGQLTRSRFPLEETLVLAM